MLKSIVAGLGLAVALSGAPSAPQATRPYSITQMSNATAFFDNGECGYVYTGMPHTGMIQSFWRPAPLDGVFTWGFTQDDIYYNFFPAPCSVGGI